MSPRPHDPHAPPATDTGPPSPPGAPALPDNPGPWAYAVGAPEAAAAPPLPPTPLAGAVTGPAPSPGEIRPGGSWPRREFIKGIIVSGVSVSAASVFGSACARPLPAQGAVERLVQLRVNGTTRPVDVLPQETLAMTLRYKLGLTGTKLGCDRAECGACTVMIDGVSHYSCTTLTHRMRGREVTTVEGLVGPNGALHPVQRAFVDELGPQCGFCTPGQVMAAAALLRANPAPTREEARVAMSGNLCRCGAYDHYLNGVMRAAELAREA